MPNNILPSLSSSGWVSEISEKAARLMAYFSTSESSQSYYYLGNVSSLPEIIKQYGNDDVQLKSVLQTRLQSYLIRYFDNVEIEVTITENTTTSEAYGLNIQVDCTVTQDNETHSLGRLINTVNSSIMKIIEINNG